MEYLGNILKLVNYMIKNYFSRVAFDLLQKFNFNFETFIFRAPVGGSEKAAFEAVGG